LHPKNAIQRHVSPWLLGLQSLVGEMLRLAPRARQDSGRDPDVMPCECATRTSRDLCKAMMLATRVTQQ
jgi:hypothetical protein